MEKFYVKDGIAILWYKCTSLSQVCYDVSKTYDQNGKDI